MAELSRSESCTVAENNEVVQENVVLSDNAAAAEAGAVEEEKVQPSPQEMLVNMEINNQNDALNCIIGYIGLAQRRGVFALDESSKLFECIKMFKQQ